VDATKENIALKDQERKLSTDRRLRECKLQAKVWTFALQTFALKQIEAWFLSTNHKISEKQYDETLLDCPICQELTRIFA